MHIRNPSESAGSPPRRDWLVAFDLDDTLYPEVQFVRSGLAAAERALKRLFDARGFARRALAWYRLGERDRMFELALEELGLPRDADTIGFLERLYVSHAPEIEPFPDVVPALQTLHLRALVAILTDGVAGVQQRKLRALGIEHFVHRVVLTDEWGRAYWKPHRRGYLDLQDWAGLPPDRCFYVGDNPLKDFQAPRRLGWQCLRVRRREGQFAGVEVPEELGMIPYCRDLSNFEDYLMPRKPELGMDLG